MIHAEVTTNPLQKFDEDTVATIIEEGSVTSGRIYKVAFVFMTALLCLPLWATKHPPLLDYPNHLARAYIIYHIDDDPIYHSEYEKLSEPIPNMAIDLIVPPLLKFFDIEVAGKIFLTSIIILFCFGCHIFGIAVHGRPTWLAFCFALFAYNQTFFWGFINYMFGVGMFLTTGALWLKHRERWSLTSFSAVSLLAFGSYLSHLSAYVFLCVLFFVITLSDWLRQKRATGNMALGLFPLIAPLIAFFGFMHGSGRTGTIIWGSPLDKFLNLVSWPVGYNYVLDFVLLLTVLLIAIALIIRAKNKETNRAILASGMIFMALYLACPLAVFTSYSADIRFVAPAVILMSLAVGFRVPRRVGALALTVFLLVCCIRVGGILQSWGRIDEKITAQLELFDQFEDGAKVYPITFFPPDKEGAKNARPIHHCIHYSTIYHHTFSPTFFGNKGQQPIVFKSKPRYTKITAQTPPDAVDWSLFDGYDYLWCYQPDAEYVQYLKERCDLVADANGAMIFRLNGEHQSDFQSATRPRMGH